MTKPLLLLLTFLTVQAHAQTMRLILVSDYADMQYGLVSMADEDIINAAFGKVKQIGYRLDTTYINQKQPGGFTKRALLKALQRPVQPNDMVVVFFSGSGTYIKPDPYPSLQLDSLLALNQVATILQKKGAKLAIVMADCRNTPTDSVPKRRPRETTITEDRSKAILTKLFLEQRCPVVKVASAKLGQPALLLGKNSVFAYAFTQAFEDMLYAEKLGEVSLQALFRNVDTVTREFIPSYTGIAKDLQTCRPDPPRRPRPR